MIEGIGFYCGLIMRWFRDAFCEAERSRPPARESTPTTSRACGHGGAARAVTACSASSRTSWTRSAGCTPHRASSASTFDADSFGDEGMCPRHRGEAAYVTLGHLQALEAVGAGPFEEIGFTGGGAKGTLWPQIVADVLGVPVRIPEVKESTALGAALFAGLGRRPLPHRPEAASRVVRVERTIEPDLAAHAIYADLYERLARDLSPIARTVRDSARASAVVRGRNLTPNERTSMPEADRRIEKASSRTCPPATRHSSSRARAPTTGGCRTGWRGSSGPIPGGP